jgi:AcrR family transcriptional regulator
MQAGAHTEAVTTRERLVLAAQALTERGGYSAASVAAIAAEAGVSNGALYRHFPSKAELFVEVFRAAAAHEMAAMNEAASAVDAFGERFDAVIETYARRVLRHRRLAWALVYEPVDVLVDAERLSLRREFRRRMAGLLLDGMMDGAISRQDADITAAAVVGAIAEALVGPLSPLADPPPDPDKTIAGIVAFCRRAIGLEMPR